YEAMAASSPNHVIFQSWHPNPSHVLPESSPSTLTYLVNRYFLPKTVLTARRAEDGITGAVTDSAGRGMANKEVLLEVPDTDASLSPQTLLGVVPMTAVSALIGLRINTECHCSEESHVALAPAIYREVYDDAVTFERDLTSQVMAPRKATNAIHVTKGQANGAFVMHLNVPKTQRLTANSKPFRVTSGAHFVLEVSADVQGRPQAGQGLLALIFLGPDGKEVHRAAIALRPQNVLSQKTTTDADGRFRIRLADGVPLNRYHSLRIKPTDAHWGTSAPFR
ncbi:MAG: hypothetical protein ACREBC_33005, partial [Pyrinomonadaceae bacterium]